MAKNTFAIFGILAVLLLGLGFASAGVDFGSSSSATQSIEQGNTATVSFTLTEDGYGNLTGMSFNTPLTLTSGTNALTSASLVTGMVTELNQSQSTGTLSLTFVVSSNKAVGTYTGDLTLSGTYTGSVSYDLPISITVTAPPVPSTPSISYCESESHTETGDLEISNFDITNYGEGSDDEWNFLDKIEMEVEVGNTNSDDNIDDIEVKVMVLNDTIENGGKDVTNKFNFDDKTITSIGRLRRDSKESVTFKIPEVSTDVDDGEYYLYFMAYSNKDKDAQCVSKSDEFEKDNYIKISVEPVDYEDSIVAKGTGLESGINTYCGQKNVEVSIPIYNLGDDKEDKVLVNVYNTELGIDESTVIDGLSDGDKKDTTFFVNMPESLEKDKYNLDVLVYFDWDDNEDDGISSSYAEETSDTSIGLNILECKVPTPTISASLDSSGDTEVGSEMVVNAIIKNNAGIQETFLISPSGFDSWAELVSVEPQTAIIAGNSTQEVTITLLPAKAGSHTFTIGTTVDGETLTQPVSVRISKKPSFFEKLGMSNSVGFIVSGIVLLVVLIFIVVIVKMITRRPKKANF